MGNFLLSHELSEKLPSRFILTIIELPLFPQQ